MANEVRLIDANALEEVVRSSQKYNPHRGHAFLLHSAEHDHFLRLLDKAPTIDPETLRPTGLWVLIDPVCLNVQCSLCGELAPVDFMHDGFSERPNYCPNCGAKMMEE